MDLSRRRVLFGGGTLLAVAWVGAHAWGHRPIPGLPTARFLGPTERRTLESALEALLPDPSWTAAVADSLERRLVEGDPIAAEQLRMALVVLEHLGGTGLLRFRRFSRLPLEERVDVLRSWEQSGLALKRQIFQGLRRTATFLAFCLPDRWREIGYDGPWVAAGRSP